MEIFMLLMFAHFLCDYPLQGNYLAMAKNRHEYISKPIPDDWPYEDKYDGVVERKWKEWFWALSGHSAIHAGAVYLITGLWYLAVAELVSHWIIDDSKCGEKINYNQDQIAHIICKFLWATVAAFLN